MQQLLAQVQAPWHGPLDGLWFGSYRVTATDDPAHDHLVVYVREAADGPDLYRAPVTACMRVPSAAPLELLGDLCDYCLRHVPIALQAARAAIGRPVQPETAP